MAIALVEYNWNPRNCATATSILRLTTRMQLSWPNHLVAVVIKAVTMKLHLGTLLVCMLFLGACKKTENILPAQDGIWMYESWEEKHFEDGVEVLDSFQTADLGGLEFLDGGEGFEIDESGERVEGSAFNWTLEGNDILIRTGSDGIPIKSVILDNRRKGQLWATNTEYKLDLGNGLVLFRTERVESLVRK